MHIHRAFASSAIIVICCLSLATVFRRVFRSEYIDGQDAGPRCCALRPTTVSLLVIAMLALGATATFLVKPLFKRAVIVISTSGSKWHPRYFLSCPCKRSSKERLSLYALAARVYSAIPLAICLQTPKISASRPHLFGIARFLLRQR
jgi:hypothetical protein